MSARPALKTTTRELLLQTATRLFAERGFDGTSIRDISEESGCNPAMVSYHFDGKEGLYAACIEPYGQSKVEAAKKILVATTDKAEFSARTIRFCEAMFDLWLEQPEVSRIVAQECNLGFRQTERIFKNTFFRCFQIFSDFFEAGQRARIIRTDFEPRTAAALLFTSMHEMMRMSDLIRKFHGVSITDPEFRKKLIHDWVAITLDGALVRPVPLYEVKPT